MRFLRYIFSNQISRPSFHRQKKKDIDTQTKTKQTFASSATTTSSSTTSSSSSSSSDIKEKKFNKMKRPGLVVTLRGGQSSSCFGG